MFAGQMRLSPVNDEPASIPSGYEFLTTGRFVDPTHPPLIRYVMAIPLLVLAPDPLASDPDAERDWHPFGRRFLFQNHRSWQSILWSARAAVIVLSIGLVALVFIWARRLWGDGPAAVAAVFLAFEPTLMGHGSLATLDAGATLTFFGSVAAYWRYRQRPDRLSFAAVAVVLALAVMAKFSNAILLLAIPLAAALCGPLPAPAPARRFRALTIVATLVLVSAACYGFRARSMAQDPQIAHHREAAATRAGIERVARTLGTDADTLMNQPIPMYDLLKGAGLQVFHAAAQDLWEDADFYQYLNGEYSRSGWRSYYLWTFGLKSTLPTLGLTAILAGLGVVTIVRRRKGPSSGPTPSRTWPVLVVPPLLHLAACSASTIAIGHRYLLPIYPFLAMGAGYVTARFARRLLGKAAIAVVLAWHVVSSVAVWPHAIAYFNEMAGGPRNGYRYLSDSNLDWGQDLLFLREDASRRQAEGREVYADVFGTVRPGDLGMSLPPIPDDPGLLDRGRPVTLYLSVNRWLLRSRAHPDGLYPFLHGRAPDRFVGVSIAVFESGSPRSSR